MAFGKKKQESSEAPVPPTAAEAAAEDRAAVQAVYPDATDAPPADAPAPEAALEEPAPEEPPAPAAGGDPLGGDALLNMFQSTQIESDDLGVLLEIAGEVEIDDLLEDLQTVAVALGISIGDTA